MRRRLRHLTTHPGRGYFRRCTETVNATLTATDETGQIGQVSRPVTITSGPGWTRT